MASRHPLDELWPVLDPPSDFGERVLHALETSLPAPSGLSPTDRRPEPPRTRPPARRTMWLLAGACAGVVAAVGVMALRPAGQPTAALQPASTLSGHLVADIRQTLAIGDRGLAVAERGAELAWFVVAGNPRVEQPRGSVFYRVDRGGPFTVATPVGDVRVTGTCFRVSLEQGDQGGTEALVEVFEGSVLLAGGGELALSAGEKGRLSLRAAPVRLDAGLPGAGRRGPETDARIRQLERALVEARRAPEAAVPPADKYYDLTPEDRRALARRCEMRYSLPRHLTSLDAPRVDESLGLPAEERSAVLRLMQEHRSQYIDALQALYVEVTGDRAIAMRLAPKSLQEDLFAKLNPQELKDARRRILEEWAQGTAVAQPGPRGPAERFMRLVSGAGEGFFEKLVELVGPERARQIRRKTTSDTLSFSPASECGPAGSRRTR